MAFTALLLIDRAVAGSSFLDPATTAAVLGAVLGGLGTYLATKGAEAAKRKELTLHLYSLLLLEVCGHQNSLQLEIDGFMPAWLLRDKGWLTGDGALTTTDLHFLWIKFRLTRLANDYLDRFLAELIQADLIVQLEVYYRLVRSHNSMAQQLESGRRNSKEEISLAYDYMKDSLKLFRSGRSLIGTLRKARGISKFFTEDHRRALEAIHNSDADLEYLIALSALHIEDLADLEQEKAFFKLSQEKQARALRAGFDPPHAGHIPELIRNDPASGWNNYLVRARDISRDREVDLNERERGAVPDEPT